jgi:prepilin-type N-terminal cleavage/methylation domain-containing protein
MNNKKGFTLVELLGVLILIAVIGVITVPTVNRIINNSKSKAIAIQEKEIIKGAKSWAASNPSLVTESAPTLIAIQTLIDQNYISGENINAIDNINYSNRCVKVQFNSHYNSYDYTISDC